MPDRTLLPLLTTGPHGSRSSMTCHYRCGNACDKPIPNQTSHAMFHEIAAQAIARRSVLKASGAGLGALVVGGLSAAPAAATGSRRRKRGGGVGRAKFRPVAPNVDDKVTSPSGWRSDVVIRWGDPVTRDAPRFDVDRQTPQSAGRQFGYNNDYLGVLPLRGDRALLVANHEYTNEGLMSATGRYDWNTKKEIAIASHGMSVVEIVRGRRTGSWVTAPHRKARRNRRITGETPFRLDGPATGDPRLRTSVDPTGRNVLGTLGNCSGGTTPWGTVLPVRRTSTATSTPQVLSTRATTRRTSVTASPGPDAAGRTWIRGST